MRGGEAVHPPVVRARPCGQGGSSARVRGGAVHPPVVRAGSCGLVAYSACPSVNPESVNPEVPPLCCPVPSTPPDLRSPPSAALCLLPRLRFAGYFECQLYKDVTLNTHPPTITPNMFSWFPIFFPLREPVYVPAGAAVEAQMWRCCSPHKVGGGGVQAGAAVEAQMWRGSWEIGLGCDASVCRRGLQWGITFLTCCSPTFNCYPCAAGVVRVGHHLSSGRPRAQHWRPLILRGVVEAGDCYTLCASARSIQRAACVMKARAFFSSRL